MTTLPFRADQVGSLLRPPELLAARKDVADGKIDAAALRAIEDKHILDAIRLQEEIGFEAVTDGEYRRRNYYVDFYERGLGGVSVNLAGGSGWDYQDRTGHRVQASLPVVTQRLRWTKPIHVADWCFVAEHTKAMAKLTIPSPVVLHFFGGRENISREAYPDLDIFWADVVDAFRKELRALYDAGCRYVQMDETSVAKFSDPHIQGTLKQRGDEWRDLLPLYTEVINAAIAEAPRDMFIAMHSCRGNNQGHWQAAGGYELVADTLFNKIAMPCYFLEYDSPRAGDFTPLKFLPTGKHVVLGLISTKNPELESIDSLTARLDEASRFVDLAQVSISPQCGFASSTGGNKLTFEQQTAKLRRVVEVAARVWG
jgi:5-methyltetrahydropteroyltriglutamate--homocysteine methyltransferase